MTMTNFEIVQNYNQAKDPKAQVAILAELNACSVEEIVDILKAGGVDGRQLPRVKSPNAPSRPVGRPKGSTSGPRTSKPSKSATSQRKSKSVNGSHIEVTMGSDVIKYITDLKARRRDLLEELKEIDHTILEIANVCKSE